LAVVVAIVAGMVFAPAASGTPVYDCTNPEVRRIHPAQCPEAGVPFLLGGGGGSTGHGGDDGGILGTIGRVLHGLTGGIL
jgi:hypothetical protein